MITFDGNYLFDGTILDTCIYPLDYVDSSFTMYFLYNIYNISKVRILRSIKTVQSYAPNKVKIFDV